MEAPADALERLRDSPLIGGLEEPVQRSGVPLQGITKALNSIYGGGHLIKRSGRSSIELGTLVHREMYEWVIEGSRAPSTPKAPSARKPRHRWTEQAIELLEANGLLPSAAEVPLAHDKLGTRVDLIAKRVLWGGYVLVSLKTGVRRGSEAPRKRRALPAPFSDLDRCERTLDDLQITAERGLARKGHGVLFDAAYVLEVPEGVLRRVPAWTADEARQDALLEALSSS